LENQFLVTRSLLLVKRIKEWVRMERATRNQQPATGNPESEITGPMLFARKAFASGPQTGFLAEKAIAKLKGSNPEFSP